MPLSNTNQAGIDSNLRFINSSEVLEYLEHFMKIFPGQSGVALNMGNSHTWLTRLASQNSQHAYELLEISLTHEPYRKAFLDAPGQFGWTPLQCAWYVGNWKAFMALLKYKPKLDAETYDVIITSTNPVITTDIKKWLQETYPHFTKATVPIQASMKDYLAQKHFLTGRRVEPKPSKQEHPEESVMTTSLSKSKPGAISFALFKQAYQDAYRTQKGLKNPWSTMKVALENKTITSMEQVYDYVSKYRGTRSARVLESIEREQDVSNLKR